MSVESQRDRGGVITGVRVDVRQLHDAWMELLFPRQREAEHTVLGRWRPETTRDKVGYWGWAALGVPLVAVLYPLVLVGFAVRFYARGFDSAATRLGVVGVVVLALVVWGALTALTYVRLEPAAVQAVAGASAVAVVSAGLAALFSQRGGRVTTVLLAYPFGVTAIFLPPVVAALYSPTVAAAVFPRSDQIAIYVLNDVLPRVPAVGERASAYLRDNYELVGGAYALMWFAIAVPVGWLLGVLVTIADVVRPKADDEETDDAE
ncbi:MAG: hypothetical protein ABEJ23_00475 [Haloarculaceae archaeon]